MSNALSSPDGGACSSIGGSAGNTTRRSRNSTNRSSIFGRSRYPYSRATSPHPYHFGPLRLTLRILYNLTPVESEEIFIECGHTKHYWHENPLFIFDDTLMHRSANEYEARRYCVFMDVIRPSPVTGLLSVLLAAVSAMAQRTKGVFYRNWKMLGANGATPGATTKS